MKKERYTIPQRSSKKHPKGAKALRKASVARLIHNIHTRVRRDWAVTENMQVPIIETQHSMN